jgi:hypothetical protein
MLRTLRPAIFLFASVGALCAQNPPADQSTNPTLEQQLKDLQRQVDELQQKIKALEEEKTNASGADTTPAPTNPAAQPALPQTVQQPESTQQPETSTTASEPMPPLHDAHGIKFRGFGEADYKVLDQRQPELGTYGFVPGSSGNFFTGDFGLFLTSRLNDHASVLSEIVFEETDAQSYKVDLRRILLKYDLNDHLKMSFGRYQTAIGYYNEVFLSAAWLQTTANRPLVMEYASNGGILPTQGIGVSVTGAVPSGKLGLNYIAEYGSADTIRPDINGDGLETDENNSNYVDVGFYLQPDSVPGLRIGGSVYHDRISNLVFPIGSNQYSETSSSARWGQTIVNGHIVYLSSKIEFLNEGFLIRHALIGSPIVFNTSAFYSQVSREIGPFRPFFRYQYVNANPQNLIYNDVGLRFGPSFGVRYDLDSYVALKAQLDHTARGGEPDLNGLQLQIAFTF